MHASEMYSLNEIYGCYQIKKTKVLIIFVIFAKFFPKGIPEIFKIALKNCGHFK
jgi:hypothetical protein